MTTATATQNQLVRVRRELCDELRRRLYPLAWAAHIGVAFEAPAAPRAWLVDCSPMVCTVSANESLITCTHSAIQRVVRFASEGLGGCQLVLCCQDASSLVLLDCIQELAEIVADLQEIGSRENLLLQELASSWETLSTLYESSLDLQSGDSLQHVTDRLLDRSVAGGADLSSLLWILEQEEFRPVGERRYERPAPRSISQGLLGLARERSVPVVLDCSADELVDGDLEPELHDAGPVVLIPVRTRQGLEAILQVWGKADSPCFETPAVRLLEAIALQAANAIENDRLYRAALEGERMRQEIEIGAGIQQHLLLGEHPPELTGVEIANYMIPSIRVGGDFYEFVRYSETCFDAIVGDVMGKGIGPALMGAATKSTLLRTIAEGKTERGSERSIPPGEIVTAANMAMSRQLIELNSFVTLFYGRCDLRANTLTYVDAGHTQTLHYIAKSDSIEMLHGEAFPLGFSRTEMYQQSEVRLGPGDIVLIYSDGMSEASDPAGQLYGTDRIKDFLLRNARSRAANIASGIKSDVMAFRGSAELNDDLTCIVVKVNPQPDEAHHQRVISGGLDQLEPVRAWLADIIHHDSLVPVADDTIFDVQLAVQEAITNVIAHGLRASSSQQIVITVSLKKFRLEIVLAYEGITFSPSSVPAPSFDGSRDHGFGLFLIDQLMDEVNYDFTQKQNTIRLGKRLSAAEE